MESQSEQQLTYLYQNLRLKLGSEDLRLINILPERSEDGLLQCRIETISLLDTTVEYNEFESECRPDLQHDALLPLWCWYKGQIGADPRTAGEESGGSATHVPRFSCPDVHRFVWGDFAALSYVWGDPESRAKIRLNDVEVSITSNLAEALEMLRETGHFASNFRLWVDALCINQHDDAEREREVGRMKQLYSLAWCVVGFIGPAAEESAKAIALADRLADYCGNNSACEQLRTELLQGDGHIEPGSWLALNHLTARPFWSRLWIIQELALGSSRARIFCGSTSINWRRFCQGLEVLHLYLWTAKSIRVRADRQIKDPADNRAWVDTGPLHHIWKDLWQVSEPEKLEREPLSLTRLMEIANFSRSADPRDKVFGLLGIMPVPLARLIPANYGVPAATVFTQVAKAYIDAYSSLELLREANTWGPEGAPSWVPDWSWTERLRDRNPQVLVHTRIENPDYEPGHESESGYDAARTLRLDPASTRLADGDRYLLTQCIFIDELDGLAACAANLQQNPLPVDDDGTPAGVTQSTSTRDAYGGGEATAAALLAALVADRTLSPPASQALFHLPLTEADAVRQFTAGGATDWPEFLTEEATRTGRLFFGRWVRFLELIGPLRLGGRPLASFFDGAIPPEADFAHYYTAYLSWIRTKLGRRLATTEQGRFAWVPHSYGRPDDEQPRPGDVFAVFPGCSTPILLRRTSSPPGAQDGRPSFRVIGEAYVHGLMDGQVGELLGKGVYRMQDVRLC
ncbi:HET-domain-containing protein [Podospora conica]|nr:HET-domain-containing protein [Schizothecium conicum]